MQQNQIVRDERGADRCHRVVKQAVESANADGTKGYKYVDAYCNKPVVLSISENQKMCPSCDKIAPVGNVHPRITNAAGVSLTAAELRECGVTEDPSLKPAPKVRAARKPKEAKAVEAKVIKQVKDAVTITVTLEQLEQGADLAGVFINAAIAAMDKLPTPTLAESKRLIKLQERLQSLLRI